MNNKSYTYHDYLNAENKEIFLAEALAGRTESRKQMYLDGLNSTANILRQQEYPSIQEQLDDLFHQGAFSPEMTARIQAVKDKFPKS